MKRASTYLLAGGLTGVCVVTAYVGIALLRHLLSSRPFFPSAVALNALLLFALASFVSLCLGTPLCWAATSLLQLRPTFTWIVGGLILAAAVGFLWLGFRLIPIGALEPNPLFTLSLVCLYVGEAALLTGVFWLTFHLLVSGRRHVATS